MRGVQMERALAVYTQQLGCVFTMQGIEEPAEFLFAAEAFLPVVAVHATIDAHHTLGFDMGLKFESHTNALLQVSVQVPTLTGDEASVLRLAFFSGAAKKIFGLDPSSRIECQSVFQSYKDGLLAHALTNGGIAWPLTQITQA